MLNHFKFGWVFLYVLTGCVGPERAKQAESERPPNFIVIFTDDQGYNDLGCFGSPLIKTPQLDRMAAEGTRFTDFYVASAVCSASRAALLTGCYSERVGVSGAFFPGEGEGLHPDEITMAELLKTRGYATSAVGKWHLGDEKVFLPTAQGFDEYFGIPYSNDMYIGPDQEIAEHAVFREGFDREKALEAQRFVAPHVHARKPIWESPLKGKVPLFEGSAIVEFPVDQATLTRRYFDRAIRFVEANREQPFFLYITPAMPHVPLYASEQFAGKSPRGLYGDVIEEIDWNVGRLLDTLRASGLDRNTVVVFTSDNGPWLSYGEEGGSAAPLRDGKFTTYEGGMRVPMIAWGPGHVAAGTTCAEVASSIDLLPTFAGLAGAELPDDRIIDGKNILPLLKGISGGRSPHQAFFYATDGVRMGRWKLMLKEHAMSQQQGPLPALYDLSNDPGEQHNLYEEHPDVVDRMQPLLEQHAEDLAEHSRPLGKESACE
ncbi:Arylsulfatase [Pontiella desulfatans]|uniref:Arylsulfatase n=1 Tax=Pontiella desulfatans TaxID=2750659 RepID=A0A6C2U8E3_PONDE|nr:sulfatase [Pontiella desulfatans]SPS74010.1 sulfatase S1_14 [Kiritimatiellales bacterium]VGO16225.1 Arylsulfatase [Pontiella desulfatans]